MQKSNTEYSFFLEIPRGWGAVDDSCPSKGRGEEVMFFLLEIDIVIPKSTPSHAANHLFDLA
jgi:hypothetical protein